MKTKGWAALCLMLLLVIVGSQFFKAPSYMKWVTEGFFSNTLAKKDDAFNHVLSKDDPRFARALTPQKFTFPIDHGPHKKES